MPLAEAQNQWGSEVLSILVNIAKSREERKNCMQIIQLTSAFLAAWCVLATKFWPKGYEGKQCVQPCPCKDWECPVFPLPTTWGHGGTAAVIWPRGRWHSCLASPTFGLLHNCHLHCWIFASLLWHLRTIVS